jgi:Ca2+/H+ antiporter, TMEM165/GDT1 family
MSTDLLAAFGLVFAAELGDKSMLLALALAARYRAAPVLGGIALAAAIMLGAAAALGAALGAALPTQPLAIVGGLLFLGFGVWTLRGEDDDEEEDAPLRSGSVLLGVTLAFLVAEFGDKTMLATATLATTRAPLPTWIGATLGMTLASGLAILLVKRLGRHLPERAVRLTAAALFLLFGVLLLLEGLLG